jgi:DNA-binding NarL/FixJ family response regulator
LKSLCVLIMVSNNLLKQAMVSLLVDQSNMTILTGELNSQQELVDEIQHYMPDVVVMAEGTGLSSTEALVSLLMLYPGLRVIVMSEENNWLHVFSKDEVLMSQATDLVDLIHSV